jgi:uncharacterized membrane protein (GlpM family)
MAVFAFRLVHLWTVDGRQALTGLQYGHLFELSAISSYMAEFRVARYFFRSKSKKRRAPAPAILAQAAWLLFAILLITALIAISDLLLHTYAKSGPLVPRTASVAEVFLLVPKVGTQVFNATDPENPGYCDVPSRLSINDCPTNSGVRGSGRWGTEPILEQGQATSSNTSSMHQVISLPYMGLDVAVIVRPVIDPSHSYTAKSVGMASQCRAITQDCDFFNPIATSTLELADGLVFDCPRAGRPGMSTALLHSATTPHSMLWIYDNIDTKGLIPPGQVAQYPKATPNFTVTGVLMYPGKPGRKDREFNRRPLNVY